MNPTTREPKPVPGPSGTGTVGTVPGTRHKVLGVTENFLLFLYQFLLVTFGPLYLVIRIFKGKRLSHSRERIGWYPRKLRTQLLKLKHPVWIHLVSVGEVMAARPLMDEMRRRLPHSHWVISTVTPTGHELAKELLRGDQDQLLVLPFDFKSVVRRVLRLVRPSLFVSFETELWPMLFHELHCGGIPIVLVNARISLRAFPKYLWIRPFMERTLSLVSLILTQSPQDARRYAAIGAPKDRIVVTGNLKWDLENASDGSEPKENPLRSLLRLPSDAILWTAGSTHPGEERMLLAVYRRLKASFPTLRLILAPRHPERIGEVEKEVLQAGWVSLRRSQWVRASDLSDPVLLLDTLGELKCAYQLSDVVFVGGSLVPHGGHNLIEPAAYSKAIVTGPHLHNFEEVAELLLLAGGLKIVHSVEELKKALQLLIEEPLARKELGTRAYRAIQEHRGATSRSVELILHKHGKALVGSW